MCCLSVLSSLVVQGQRLVHIWASGGVLLALACLFAVGHGLQSISWMLRLLEFFDHLCRILTSMLGLAPIDRGSLVFDHITHLWSISAWVSVVLWFFSPACACALYSGERHHGLILYRLLRIGRCIHLGLRVSTFKVIFFVADAIMVLIFSKLDDSAHDMHNLLLIWANLIVECGLHFAQFFLSFALHDVLGKVLLELDELCLQMHAHQVQLVTFHFVAHLGVNILIHKWAYSISSHCSSFVKILLLDERKLDEILKVFIELAFSLLFFFWFIQQLFVNLQLWLDVRLTKNFLQVLIQNTWSLCAYQIPQFQEVASLLVLKVSCAVLQTMDQAFISHFMLEIILKVSFNIITFIFLG